MAIPNKEPQREGTMNVGWSIFRKKYTKSVAEIVELGETLDGLVSDLALKCLDPGTVFIWLGKIKGCLTAFIWSFLRS